MDYFLIIILGIVVISVWNSSRDANERMRDAVDRLEREIEFLRSQLAALMKARSSEPAGTSDVDPTGGTGSRSEGANSGSGTACCCT